jgi:hypothetical protein
VSLDLKRTGLTSLRGFLGTHIFRPDWGSRFNNKQRSPLRSTLVINEIIGRVLEFLGFLIRNKEKFEIGLGNSRKEADAMPSDFRRLDSLTLAR